MGVRAQARWHSVVSLTVMLASPASVPAALLRTRASFFIEPEAMLSRASALHDALWDGVRKVRAPSTMYSPWAPYPHYAVGALRPPTNNGTVPCITSWNLTLMDQMIDDYLNATAFDTAEAPYFLFSQSPCWMWVDGDLGLHIFGTHGV